MSDAGSRGLSVGRNWGALPLRHDRLEWTMEADGSVVQGPHKLEEYLGQRMLLNLEPGQFGLLIQDGGLRAVYLEGCHHLDIGTREDQISTENGLLLINCLEPMVFHFGTEGPEAYRTADGTGVMGRCGIRIARPSRFYQRVLRQAGSDWSSESLQASLAPLVRKAFHDLLGQSCADGHGHPGGLQSALMDLQPGQLDEHLEINGLFCESLAAYTDTPPLEHDPDAGALQTPELLHN